MSDEQKALDTLDTVNTNPTIISLQLNQIEVDNDFNARTEPDPGLVLELVESIRKRGLINPLVVGTPKNGKYPLVSGFTRYAALARLEKELRKAAGKDNPMLVSCRLMDFGDDASGESHITNLIENIQRKNLTTFEIAAKLKFLKDTYGYSGAQLSKLMTVGDESVGGGKNHVNNLIRAFENLHPDILAAWKAQHPLAITMRLFKFATKEHDEQLEEWNALVNPPDEDEGEDEDDGNGEEKASKKKKTAKEAALARPRGPIVETAIKAVRASDKSKEWIEGAVAALKFAAGHTRKIPGVYDPDAIVRNAKGGPKKPAASRASA